MYSVAGPDRRAVRCCQLLQGGLNRTKKFAKVYYLCLSGPVSGRGGVEQSFFRREEFLIEFFLSLVCDVPAVAAARIPHIARHWYQDDQPSPPPMF